MVLQFSWQPFLFGFTSGGLGLAIHLPFCHTKAKWDEIFGYPLLLMLSHTWKKPTSFGHLTWPEFFAGNINFNIFFNHLSHYLLFAFTKFNGGMTSKLFYVVKKMLLISWPLIPKNMHCSILLNLKLLLNILLLLQHLLSSKWKLPLVLKGHLIPMDWPKNKRIFLKPLKMNLLSRRLIYEN